MNRRTCLLKNIKIVFVHYSYYRFSFSWRYMAILLDRFVSKHIVNEKYLMIPPVLLLSGSSFFGQSHVVLHGHCLFGSCKTLQSCMAKLESKFFISTLSESWKTLNRSIVRKHIFSPWEICFRGCVHIFEIVVLFRAPSRIPWRILHH
jgi:hypothetical protein